MITEVILPQLGQTMSEGTIIEWLAAEGDRLDAGDVLFKFESDKATLEVEAPKAGVLRKILVSSGATCPVLTPVGLIADGMSEDISSYLSVGEKATPQIQDKPEFDRGITSIADAGAIDNKRSKPEGRIHISPRARSLARKMDVNLALVQGSGEGGRIIEKDVKVYLEARPKISPVARRMADLLGWSPQRTSDEVERTRARMAADLNFGGTAT